MPKIYSFFLPQFHESAQNNKWWGKGFTEWNLVRNAQPLYDEHHQPRIPLNGYFDLSETKELNRQFKLANDHGIDGFVFYHYWYEGTQLLGKPIKLILDNPQMDTNFSLCWANHSWTRSWKNRQGALDMLIEQTYEKDYKERVKHFEYLNKVFADPRYIKIDNKPLFQIYKPEDIPNLDIFLEELREYTLKKNNIQIHISGIITGWRRDWKYLKSLDSATLAQPALSMYSPNDLFNGLLDSKERFNTTALLRSLPQPMLKLLYKVQDKFYNKVKYFDYDEVWKKLISQYKATSKSTKIPLFTSSFVDFDNTARYGKRARIMKGFSPEKFGRYFSELVKAVDAVDGEAMFINAWNEWGEGMYLQPDKKHGNKRLEQIKEIKKDYLQKQIKNIK